MAIKDLAILIVILVGIVWIVSPDTIDTFLDDTLLVNKPNESSVKIDGLTVANWNLQVFGPSKADDITLLRKYAEKIEMFDIIFLQELRDSTEASFNTLCNSVSQTHECSISSRAGRTTSKEQYGIVYRKGIEIYNSQDFNPDSLDRWERPPIRVDFRLSNGYNFSAYNIHIKPSDVTVEMDYLEDIVIDEGNVMIIGDLNADCSYYDPVIETQFDDWHWLINDREDTTVAATDCAYDRIIVNDDLAEDVFEAGVIGNIQPEESDHYIVWVSIDAEE